MFILTVLILLIFFWRSRIVSGINEDYFSYETTKGLKGVFSLVVVLHHLAQNTKPALFFSFIALVGPFIVSIFFFISGYGLQKKHLTDSNYGKTFLAKRIPTLLIPYLLISFVYWCINAVSGNIYSLKECILSIFSLKPLVPYSWYIANILFYYLVFYFLMKFARRKFYFVFGVALSYLLWIFICLKSALSPWWYYSSHIIGMGIVWASYEKEIIQFIKAYYYLILSLSFSMFVVFFLMQNKSYYDLSSFIYVAGSKAIAIALYIFTILLLLLKIKIGNLILKLLGEISYELYLSHAIFVNLFNSRFFNIKDDLLFSLVVIISSFVFSFLFHKLCKFVLSRYYKLLK